MPHTFTRQELFNLVWSMPMRTLAQELGLSDVGLAKACKKANIPRPPRGYWAKLKVGKTVQQTPLPARGPGMGYEVIVGGGRYGYSRYDSDDEILAMEPRPPEFEDDIDDVEARVISMVGKVTVPMFPERAHRQIRLLLEADEERRQKQLNSRYPSSWDRPLFDDPFEKRRLRLLNAIISNLEMHGMKPLISGPHARDLSVRINDTTVSFALDATSQNNKPDPHRAIDTRGSSNKLKFLIHEREPSPDTQLVWEEHGTHRLEKDLREIVVALIFAGERQYRKSKHNQFEWLVQRKENLIEKIRQREAEARRLAEERRIQMEQARIDRLLADANSLRQAREIRDYVAAVQKLYEGQDESISEDKLDTWANWALSQAERIDPVQSRRFVESMSDEDPSLIT